MHGIDLRLMIADERIAGVAELMNYPGVYLGAESELAKHFGDLDAPVRDELATSLVRQWLTNDGYAGLVTPTRQCWFQLLTREGGGLNDPVQQRRGAE